MASWKKVIVSGSNANLTQLQVDNLTSGQVVIGGGASNLSTTAINGTGTIVATTGASGLSHSGSFSGSFQGSIIGGNAFIQGGNSFGTAATLGTNDNQSLNFETNGIIAMTIVSSSGNIGIGTTTPRSALDVLNGVIYSQENWTTQGFFLGDLDAGASNAYITGYGGNINSYLDLATDAKSRLRIDTSGNVGIGTITPSERLHVSGSVNIEPTFAYKFGGRHALHFSRFFGGEYTNTYIGDGATSISESFIAYSTHVGTQAGFNGLGSNVVSVGRRSGYQNIGDDSVFIGYDAGYQILGSQHTIVGYQAGYQANGGFITAVGKVAGYKSQGTMNTFIGNGAGNAYSGSYATLVGDIGGTTSGSYTVLLGSEAGSGNKADNTIAIGRFAGYGNKGNSNVFIGFIAGAYTNEAFNFANTSSAESVFLGSNTISGGGGRTNQIVIGYGASGIGSNSVVLGNNSITTTALKGFVGIGITTPSASLHVTNTTTSASLLIDDSTNPDVTPFLIDASGSVAIGKLSPNAKLDVSGSVIITGSLTVTAGITGSLLGTASTASFVTASGVFGPYGANSVISASYAVQSAASLGTLTFGEGLTAGTYNGSGNVTLTVSGAAQLTDNAITKWNNTDNKFVVSSLTDNGTTVTGASSIQLTGAASALTGSFTGSFKGDGSGLTGLATELRVSASNGTNFALDLLTQDLTLSGTSNQIDTYISEPSVVSFGFPSDVIMPNNLTVTGDLYVNGTTTTVNTADLYIEDKFILLASGSANAGDGGIIIDRGSDSDQNIAYGYDSATDRWGFQNGITDSSNALDPTSGNGVNGAFVGYVFTEAAHTSTKPTTGEFVVPGAIYTNTDGTIWMYA